MQKRPFVCFCDGAGNSEAIGFASFWANSALVFANAIGTEGTSSTVGREKLNSPSVCASFDGE